MTARRWRFLVKNKQDTFELEHDDVWEDSFSERFGPIQWEMLKFVERGHI